MSSKTTTMLGVAFLTMASSLRAETAPLPPEKMWEYSDAIVVVDVLSVTHTGKQGLQDETIYSVRMQVHEVRKGDLRVGHIMAWPMSNYQSPAGGYDGGVAYPGQRLLYYLKKYPSGAYNTWGHNCCEILREVPEVGRQLPRNKGETLYANVDVKSLITADGANGQGSEQPDNDIESGQTQPLNAKRLTLPTQLQRVLDDSKDNPPVESGDRSDQRIKEELEVLKEAEQESADKLQERERRQAELENIDRAMKEVREFAEPQPANQAGESAAQRQGDRGERRRRKLEPVELQPTQPPIEYAGPSRETNDSGELPRATVSAKSADDDMNVVSDPQSSSDNGGSIVGYIAFAVVIVIVLLAAVARTKPSNK